MLKFRSVYIPGTRTRQVGKKVGTRTVSICNVEHKRCELVFIQIVLTQHDSMNQDVYSRSLNQSFLLVVQLKVFCRQLTRFERKEEGERDLRHYVFRKPPTFLMSLGSYQLLPRSLLVLAIQMILGLNPGEDVAKKTSEYASPPRQTVEKKGNSSKRVRFRMQTCK